MKMHKKIGLGLLGLVSLFAGLFFTQTSLAAPSFSASWIDRSYIRVTGEGKDFVLYDKNWDGDWDYRGDVDGCDESKIDGFNGDLIVGFGKNNDGHPSRDPWKDSLSNANLVINYKASATDTSCTTVEIKNIHINDWQNARISFRWTDSGHSEIQRIDSPDDWTFSNPVKITSGFNSGKTRFFRQSEAGNKCQDVIDVSADGTTMWFYEQQDKSGGGSPVDPSNCKLYATIDDITGNSAVIDDWHNNIPSNFVLPLGETFAPPTSGGNNNGGNSGGTTTPSANDDEAVCYGSNFSLSWLFCPVINVAQQLAEELFGFVENQLKFRVEAGNQADSLGDPQTKKDIKSAWNSFRILVSGLVVILMLIMVIGQAIGTGPFDAYTVKKMLPRLVAGVILIQLSWPIFTWVVNTADDLGRGLADIMYAPFGGAGNMELGDLLKDKQGTSIGFNWIAFLGTIVALVMVPFLVLGAILTVLVAIFVGFLTLLFRKILIILALIVVPVALIAWMMPNDGLRRYWKLWWDNFLKALLMFPLIILIIAGGRIFAKIGGGQADLVGFFIVLVGFFGPLFILPKTFKWGGQAMQFAGSGLAKFQAGALKKPQELLQARQKEWKDLRTQRSQLRMMEHGESLRKGWGRNPLMWWQRPLDLTKAGKLDPTRGLPKMGRLYGGSEMRRDATAAYVEAGEKRYQERRGAAAQKWQRTVEEQIDESGGNPTKDKVFQDIADRIDTHFIDYNGNRVEIKASDLNEMDQRVALDRLAKLGGAQNFRHIEKAFEQAMRSGDQHTAQRMRKFLNDNVDTLLPKMTHLYKGYASTSDASPENISQMHGVEIEAMLAEYSHRIATGTDSRGRAVDVGAARSQLNNFLTSYTEAASDPQLRGRLEAGGLRAVSAFMSGNPNHQFLVHPNTGIQGADAQSRLQKIYVDGEHGGVQRTINLINPAASAGIIVDPQTLADLQTHVIDRAR